MDPNNVARTDSGSQRSGSSDGRDPDSCCLVDQSKENLKFQKNDRFYSVNRLDMVAKNDTILFMNRSHRKILAAAFTDPVPGNIEWRRIEALFRAVGCDILEGSGSRITVVHAGRKAAFHRPHPGKEALRYQIRAVRDFLEWIGVTP